MKYDIVLYVPKKKGAKAGPYKWVILKTKVEGIRNARILAYQAVAFKPAHEAYIKPATKNPISSLGTIEVLLNVYMGNKPFAVMSCDETGKRTDRFLRCDPDGTTHRDKRI